MCRLGRFVLILTILIILFGVGFFVLENQQEVVLSFLGWGTLPLPVSFFVVLSLIVGMAIGPILGVLVRQKRRRSTTSNRTKGERLT
ncbi:LapA family protein [Pseudomonas sp. SB113]|uniref:lipopolysaccharide assembly protein LapA domain-containing protein n=1 Tax=Pseudomonas sp. SB113 TaxID=3154123 RepID=UPI00345D73A2